MSDEDDDEPMLDEDEESEDNKFTISLAIDRIYYCEAIRISELASATHRDFVEAQKAVSAGKDNLLDYLNNHERDPNDTSDDAVSDGLSDELNDRWAPVEIAATELVRKVATAHILFAASLEAHINIRAERILQEDKFKEFEKLSITDKWLNYSKDVGKRFDRGREPFQGFRRLIKRRNALLHFKAKRTQTHDPFEVPQFVKELGLLAPATQQSLSAARAMIVALAEMERRDVPEWIDGGDFSAFDWDYGL
jgi:hypothetical protein